MLRDTNQLLEEEIIEDEALADAQDEELQFDPNQTRKFLSLLDPNAVSFTFFTAGEGDDKGNRKLTKTLHGSFEDLRNQLQDLNNQGAGIFVTINETDLKGRKKANITRIRAIWQDDDDGYVGSYPLPDSISVNTSAEKYQRYWLAEGLDRDTFSSIMERMVKDYGSDPNAKDLSRVLRLPGFYHMKGEPQLVKMVWPTSDCKVVDRYAPKHLLEAFPPLTSNSESLSIKLDSATHVDVWEAERPHIIEALEFISSDCRDAWRHDVGAALHNVSGGHEEGYVLFNQWSAKSKKYVGKPDTHKEWGSYKIDHGNPKTIASLFDLAKKNGWTGKHGPVDLSKSGAIPKAKSVKPGELTANTIKTLRQTFEGWADTQPSGAQWQGLIDLVSHLEAMANGDLEPLYYLSSLDPGVGKTQAIIHFVQELLRSEDHKDVSMIVCVGRLNEIRTLIDQIGLNEEDFAVEVGGSKDNEELNAMGNFLHKDRARLLFTTQQLLESKAKRRAFNDIPEFQYKGRPREIRIWDESQLPARPLSIKLTDIEGMTSAVENDPKLLELIRSLISDIERKSDSDFVDIPDFENEHNIFLNDVLALFDDYANVKKHDGKKPAKRDRSRVEKAVSDLWILAGKTVVLRHGTGGNTAIHYEDTWPDDLKPIVVCDASGRVRQTYAHWSEGRGDLVHLQHGTKNYSNLTVHIWRKAGSKSSWSEHSEELVEGVVKTINSKPDEKWLVVHHLKSRSFKIDVPNLIKMQLTNPDKVSFIHWGDHSASNDYRDIENVILAGTQFYGNPGYEALARACRGLKSDDKLDKKHFREIQQGEHAHLILQALCRGSVRKNDGYKCFPCNAYIIAHPQHGIPKMLEDGIIFPDCKIEEWYPIKKELGGRAREAYDYILAQLEVRPDEELKVTEVRRYLRMEANNFRNDVVNHPDFEMALSSVGVKIDRERPKKKGMAFIRN